MSLLSRDFLEARPQELGKIKIGMKGGERQGSGGSWRQPKKLDHFRVTTRTRGKDENFERDEEIHAVVGEKPRELEGWLMFHTVGDNLHTEMQQYAGRTKALTCDGESCTVLKTGEVSPCPRRQGQKCPELGTAKKCKPYARLHLQLKASPTTGGYHVFRTTSWETANNLQTFLEEIFRTFGTLYHAPVKLILYEAPVQFQDGGQQKTGTAWKVGMVLAMPRALAGETMVTERRQLAHTARELKLLAAAVEVDLEDTDDAEAAEIADEFHPPREAETADATDEKLAAMKEALGVGRESEAPVVDAEVEDDEDAPEQGDLLGSAGVTDDPASDGVVANLRGLRDKAAAKDLLDFALEGRLSDALERRDRTECTLLVGELSLLLLDAREANGG